MNKQRWRYYEADVIIKRPLRSISFFAFWNENEFSWDLFLSFISASDPMYNEKNKQFQISH